MAFRKMLAAILVAVFLAVIGSANIRGAPTPDVTEPPLTGEELWRSLPPELLSNVIENKMEEVSSYQDRIRCLEAEIVRVKEIQACKMASPRPPPDK